MAEAVEKGVEGLFDFLARYARTVWLVVGRPRAGLGQLARDRRQPAPRFVMPLTFAAIGVFLLSLITRVAGANLLNWIWFYNEIWANVAERLTKEISLIAVAIGAVPAMLGVFSLSGLQALALGRRYPAARLVFLANSYAVGSQAALVFLAGFLLAAGQFEAKHPIWTGSRLDAAGGLLYVLAAASIIVAVVVIPWFLLASLRVSRLWRRSKARAVVAGALIVITSLSGLAVYPALAGLPDLALRLAKPPGKPEVGIASSVAGTWRAGEVRFEFGIVIHNKSDAALGFAPSDIRPKLEATFRGKRDVLGLTVAEATDEQGRPSAFVSAAPGALVWRRIAATARVPSRSALGEALAATPHPCISVRVGTPAGDIGSVCVYQSFSLTE